MRPRTTRSRLVELDPGVSQLLREYFHLPCLVVGVLQLLNNWGVYTILMINMIEIFRGSATSIPADQAPVYVGILQVTNIRL